MRLPGVVFHPELRYLAGTRPAAVIRPWNSNSIREPPRLSTHTCVAPDLCFSPFGYCWVGLREGGVRRDRRDVRVAPHVEHRGTIGTQCPFPRSAQAEAARKSRVV